MIRVRPIVAASLLTVLASTIVAADIQLGSKDFYPSERHPVGFRGDGNGYFPGATPVSEFWEGTPIQVEKDGKDRSGKDTKQKFWDFSDTKSKNLVWKTEMPGWANTQPIVVGDKVFCYGEPDLLICTDANTGKILWKQIVNPWACAGVEAKTAETCRELYHALMAVDAVIGMQFHFGTCGRYMGAEEYGLIYDTFADKDLPILLKNLATIDPQGKYEEAGKKLADDLKAGKGTFGADGKGCWDQEKKLQGRGGLHALLADRINTLSEKKIPLGMPWGNMVGWCMSAPISDGKYVYVQMGQGQTACYDLNGKEMWKTLYEYGGGKKGPGGPSTHHILSPLLAGGILVDMHGGNTLRGLGAKVGYALWETSAATTQKSSKSGYYLASHMIMYVKDTPIIVSSQCNLIRATDGKILGEYVFGEAWHGAAPIAGLGDIFVKAGSGDGWQKPFKAFQLQLDGDKASAKELWECKESPGGYNSRIVLPDYTFLGGNATFADNKTGQVVLKATLGGEFRVIAGNLLISYPSGSHAWSNRRYDGKAIVPFQISDVSNPRQAKMIGENNILGGENQPRLEGTEKFIPNLWADSHFFNAKGGKPGQMVHTDTCLFPSGNRLFIRTASHLYCIGDPNTKYDWNPASKTATK